MKKKKVFDYTRKNEFNQLGNDQQEFMARMMVREVEKYAIEHDVSPETVYELYRKGMLGSDRQLG